MLEFNGQPVTLKYLYVARFADGKIYEQNPEDISVLDPQKSCFFDILKEQETNPVESFALTDGDHAVALDLPSGTFNVNGVSYLLHEEGTPYFNKRLIFFRRRSVDTITQEEISCKYAIGWQGNVSADPGSACEQFKIFVD